MNCSMCQNPEEYTKFFIKEFDYWKVELHGNQCYLGRCIIMLKRHLEDLFEISNEERNELFEVVRDLKSALKATFNQELINYSSLGNKTNHLHLHVIPRYKNPEKFKGATFTDKSWGNNPYRYEKEFLISKDIYNQVISAIKSHLP